MSMSKWNECKKCGKKKYSPTCPYCGFTGFFVAVLTVFMIGCASSNSNDDNFYDAAEPISDEEAVKLDRALDSTQPKQIKGCNLRLDPGGSVIQVVEPNSEPLSFFGSDHENWFQVAVGDDLSEPSVGYMHRSCFEED